MRQRNILWAAVVVSTSVAAYASPITYNDTPGDQVGSTNKARDIQSVVVSNDASNLTFTINLDPGATLGTVSFDYGIGITSGPGANGDLSTDTVFHGNEYKRTLSIASSQGGMTNWIGLFPAGGAGTTTSPWTSYGFNDYIWNNTAANWGSAAIETVLSGEPMSTQGSQTGLSSITVTVPMADLSNLALATGSSFLFDVYSTGTSAGQTAYDSLADPSPTNATNSATIQYDGTLLETYTIQAPEPASASFMAMSGLMLLASRKRRAE